jgi:hypothetical protein
MPRTITITIDDDHVAAIENFLRPQLRQRQDPTTGLVVTEPIYPGGLDEFITTHLNQLFEGIYNQFPPDSVRQKLAQIKALQDEVKAMARPNVASAPKS